MQKEDLMTTVPLDESCAQVGKPNYALRAGLEADTFIRQLKKEFGRPPYGSYFDTCHHDHDLGSYVTVAFYYDWDNRRHEKYLEKVMDDLPGEWSEASEQILRENGYYDD